MEYYRTLHLEKEPFSNTPDPGLFFNSRQHRSALQKLEISIRLRRGLNVITGDVGTGKTTVCRQLIRKISNDPKIRYFLILDPGFSSATEFLSCILHHFSGTPLTEHPDNELALKEKIKTDLFSSGVDNDITTVLMIDEGQKLPLFCLETLRELLNYETNDKKLLQIVIFAQKEFDPMISRMENFIDRINFRFTFSPLSFSETRDLIRFRIEQAASPENFDAGRLPAFTLFGFWAVYRITKGYPRKIINLCHHVLLTMIIQDRQRAGSFFVHACAGEVFSGTYKKTKVSFLPAASVMAVVLVFFLAFNAKTLVNMVPEPVRQMAAQWIAAENEHIQPASVSASGTPVTVKIKQFRPTQDTRPGSDPGTQDVSNADARAPSPESEPPESKQPDPPVNVVVPALLGAIRIPNDDNLCAMISTLYGTYSRKLLGQVMASNPQIDNPDQIMSGQRVNFPVIPEASDSWRSGFTCLVGDSASDIGFAYKKAREYRKRGKDTRILTTWSDARGFMFYVVVNQVFPSKKATRGFAAKDPDAAKAFRQTPIASLVEDRTIL